jgi:preprotein translocase subunit SecF
MYRFLGEKKKWWLGISLGLILPGIAALFAWGVPFGIDFRGGAVAELEFEQPVTEGELREEITGLEQIGGAQISVTGEGSYLIRTLPLEQADYRAMIEHLEQNFGTVTERQFQNVGPSVSRDLTRKAIIAVILAVLLIVLYLAYSFRGVRHPVSPWRFGVTATLALLHDLIITVGIFAILARFFNFEVDASFITALLTIMGFSVHDTIVVYDRLRENLTVKASQTQDEEFEAVADRSLTQTLNRSLTTSLTLIFTIATIVLLGGESIRAFAVVLLIGVTVGTYSSIFTATPLLTLWQIRITRGLPRG